MEKILKSKTLAEPTPGAEADENGVVPKTKYLYYFINYRNWALRFLLKFLSQIKMNLKKNNNKHHQIQASQNA